VAGPFPILILSGHGDERIAVEAMKAGAFDYIEKSAGAFAAIPRTVERSLREWNLLQARRRAEETLVRMEENYRRSLDDSPLGVRIASAAGKTLYANRELLNCYGYDRVEDIDQTPLKERYSPQSYAEFQIRKHAREQGEFGPREYEIAVVRKNGEIRHLQVFRKEVFWDGEKQFQALYRDITEEKKRAEAIRRFEAKIQGQKMLLEQQSSSVEELIGRLTHSREELAASYEALKANKDDLVRSEKLAFTGRMAAGIAHEIRNPLTNIVLSLRQLKKGDGLKPEGHPYAEIMERNSKRIEYLVTELLNCARPIKLDLQPWDIHGIIEGALTLVRVRQKMQKIKVTKNLTAQPAILSVDKEYLGRVLLNILSNAIEAMPHGGALSIETKKVAGRFRIKIQDDGIGISEKNLLRIFDPFFSTKKGGTGLGLSTCQNIVTSHGGMIEVESAWRKGSAFVVSLPLESKPSGYIEGT
jgi:PAS domain S-box-containing protein